MLVFTIIKILVDNDFRSYGSWLGLIAAAIGAVGVAQPSDRSTVEIANLVPRAMREWSRAAGCPSG